MNKQKHHLLLADDDEDDCAFFKEALEEIPLSTTLETVNDGESLMRHLSDTPSTKLPDILFLDLNMPRKSGFDCLSELKTIDTLKDIPVIIFSTSLDNSVVDLLYEKGAIYYIRKPGNFSKLRKAIFEALTLFGQNGFKQPARDQFILEP